MPDKPWSIEDAVGYIDESGSMVDGERHVMAGVFFPASSASRAENLASSLLRQTADYIDRKGRNKGPKAIMLPKFALEEFAEGMLKLPTLFVNQIIDCKSCLATSLQSDADRIVTSLRELQKHLKGADSLDIKPHLAIRQFEVECQKHPIYIPLLFYVLRGAAAGFRALRILPRVNLCIDEHLHPKKGDLPPTDLIQFLLRWLFYSEFPKELPFSLADVFGLRGPSPLKARYGTDRNEPCLYLADIYAHSCGMVAKDIDPDGRHATLIQRIELASSRSRKG